MTLAIQDIYNICEKIEPPSPFAVKTTMTNVNCQSTPTPKHRRERERGSVIFVNNNDISSRAVNNDKTIAGLNFGSCDRTFTR